MIRRSAFICLVVCSYLSQYSIQATVFSCDNTASCGCSRFNANINARIVGGETAASHSWGWAVSLRISFAHNICGGSILSRYYVLTAAHCVENRVLTPSVLSIVVGADTLNSTEGQTLSLSEIFIHPNYDSRTKKNDIAILYLSKPIDFNDLNVAQICLPTVPESEQFRYPIVNRLLVAIGWGRNASGGSLPNSLRQVTVRTIGNKERTCQSIINNVEFQFCAAVNGGGKDTCQGDSGGPLMYYSEKDKLWVLAGITSYGLGCALADYAGVYTRVSLYIKWIRSIVGDDSMVTIPQNKANIDSMSILIIFILISFRIMIRI
ncbi:unnamed protein product [Rotaria sp. Silwood2]|nr:unnamed protein product [Rotaria sp. Silwood2]CAF2887424.1 unnamed protein product [Rotaria sp. Silwood2]